MTFQDALEKIRDVQSLGYIYHLGNVVQSIAAQVEANRLAIEQLKHELHHHHHGDVDVLAPEIVSKPWTPPKLELRGNRVVIVRNINGKPIREES